VLIDDLITRGASEPYRMFTSRAEYRLSLREDNADLRLTPVGRELGLVDDERWEFFERKRQALEQEAARLRASWVYPGTAVAAQLEALAGVALPREQRADELLRRPEVTHAALSAALAVEGSVVAVSWSEDERLAHQVPLQLEVEARYAGYVERQREEIERQRRFEDTALPPWLDFATVRGLSNEVRQRLLEHRPATLGQAARIPGVTPAAVSLLLVHLKRSAPPDTGARATRVG
jgi:tRNA uridine 5-carboxymethylaminomethyl modification enzyme